MKTLLVRHDFINGRKIRRPSGSPVIVEQVIVEYDDGSVQTTSGDVYKVTKATSNKYDYVTV